MRKHRTTHFGRRPHSSTVASNHVIGEFSALHNRVMNRLPCEPFLSARFISSVCKCVTTMTEVGSCCFCCQTIMTMRCRETRRACERRNEGERCEKMQRGVANLRRHFKAGKARWQLQQQHRGVRQPGFIRKHPWRNFVARCMGKGRTLAELRSKWAGLTQDEKRRYASTEYASTFRGQKMLGLSTLMAFRVSAPQQHGASVANSTH